jgi:hypothetical protein
MGLIIPAIAAQRRTAFAPLGFHFVIRGGDREPVQEFNNFLAFLYVQRRGLKTDDSKCIKDKASGQRVATVPHLERRRK